MANLTIAVVTMNRAKQLKEAIISCMKCNLEVNTKFVIIDNASTDDTEQIVTELFSDKNYEYYYEKLSQNLGVGGGRNYAYKKSDSKYTYFLDDDALIDYGNNTDFFEKAIAILDANPDIVTLTTQIYDNVWKKNRLNKEGHKLGKGLFLCKTFCGGSHFLRNDFFSTDPYLPNKYGFEEIPASLRVFNERKVNAFCSDLLVYHCPVINKWDYKNTQNYKIIINECAVPYAIKKMMYPIICYPILRLAFNRRCKKYIGMIPSGKKKAEVIAKETMQQYPVLYKIKLTTVIMLFREFKFAIF